MISIRERTTEDAPRLARIEQESIEATAHDFYSPDVVSAWMKSVKEENFQAAHPDWIHFVAAENGEVVGFVNFSQHGRVGGFYVDKNHQGKGVGRLLMERIEMQAKEWDVKRLDCLASLNAEGFYKKMGFHFVEEKEHSFEECVAPMVIRLMEKNL